MIPQRAAHRARLRQLARQLVHLGVAPVAHQETLLGIEHAEPQGHVVDRRVELKIEPLELALLLQQLDRLGLEDGHRARELAHLVLVRQAGDVDRGVVAGEADERRADALQARQHAAQQQQARCGPISSPLTAAAAHTQVMSVRDSRPCGAPLRRCERAPLALGQDVAWRFLAAAAYLATAAWPARAPDLPSARTPRCLALQGRRIAAPARARDLSHTHHQRGDLAVAGGEGALVAHARIGVEVEGRGGHQPRCRSSDASRSRDSRTACSASCRITRTASSVRPAN